RRAACDRLHHRRLNFEEIESVEEITQIPDYPGSCAKDVAARFVDDQIDITLAIAHLDIGESVPLVRQRPQRLDEQAQALDPHRELARIRAEDRPGRADDVADIPGLEVRVRLLTHRVLLQKELDLSGTIGDVGEADLALAALEHHAATDADARRIGVEPFAIALAVGALQLPRERGAPEVVREGRPAALAQGCKLAAALRDQLVLIPAIRRAGAPVLPLVCHIGHRPALSEASMN